MKTTALDAAHAALGAVAKATGHQIKTWTLTGSGGPYEVKDYGPKIGIQVTREGFTVWTGFRRNGEIITDASTLSQRHRDTVADGLLRQDPDRKEQGGLFGESKLLPEKTSRAKPAGRAPVQVDLFSGVGSTGRAASPDLFAGVGPLFSQPRR